MVIQIAFGIAWFLLWIWAMAAIRRWGEGALGDDRVPARPSPDPEPRTSWNYTQMYRRTVPEPGLPQYRLDPTVDHSRVELLTEYLRGRPGDSPTLAEMSRQWRTKEVDLDRRKVKSERL